MSNEMLCAEVLPLLILLIPCSAVRNQALLLITYYYSIIESENVFFIPYCMYALILTHIFIAFHGR